MDWSEECGCEPWNTAVRVPSRKEAAPYDAPSASVTTMNKGVFEIMLYRTLKRMIERGQTEGLEEKIDIFFAAGKLTEAEYTELMGMLA